MLLSVIIVSYEVKYFLEHCLCSVDAACKQLEKEKGAGVVEIIVVDNNSQDGSIEYLQNKFDSVSFHPNTENVGFGRANNQGLQCAKGEFVLFLNPDTILPETIFSECLAFFQSNNAAGALGVRMIDGQGRFLPESKRGFPTAWRSFGKLSGLSSLFPSSKLFAGYNLGYLDSTSSFEVDALAGAFLMARKTILNEIGGFDEQFFMYAEDIDLSKRIQEAGYKNYYLGNQVILHFKGESTKRDRRYVSHFYRAMNLYVKKHYKGVGSRLSVSLINVGIAMRRAVAKANMNVRADTARLPAAVSFMGDKDQQKKLKKYLPTIADNAAAEIVIICQGSEFSFADVIQAIANLPTTKHAIVYSSESSSLVGSFRNDQQGFAIPLPGP